MRKLNPFQMPQVYQEPPNDPVASTSSAVPCNLEKQMFDEPLHELNLRVDDDVMQPCSSNPDLFNIVLAEQQLQADPSRPRQYGRRSNPVRISSFQIESSDNGAAVRCNASDMIARKYLI